MGKYGHFQRSVNLLTPMGLFCIYLLCTLLTVSYFQRNMFGEIVNSGSQSNSKVQSTLINNNIEVQFVQAQDQQVVTTRSPRIITEYLLTRSILIKMYVHAIYS